MKHLNSDIKLLIVFLVLLAGTLISESLFRRSVPLEYESSMNESVMLTKRWFLLIDNLKKEKKISSDAITNVPYKSLIGNEWSEITTTLGSLEAKETSTNPDFSALTVRLLHEAGITKGDKVGVILSGSFPALAISVLAAIQTMDLDALVMSSVGASTYGANQPEVTWIDMESELSDRGGLKYRSAIVSIGAGDDSGEGLSSEGVNEIQNSADRNNVKLFIPASLKESIDKRVELLLKQGISILINIGGNQTALGNCAHSTSIPNGFNTKSALCTDENRGLITRMNELGIPYINLLSIKDLAGQYGIAVSPGINYPVSRNLYQTTSTDKKVLTLILAIGLIPVYFLRKNLNNK